MWHVAFGARVLHGLEHVNACTPIGMSLSSM